MDIAADIKAHFNGRIFAHLLKYQPRSYPHWNTNSSSLNPNKRTLTIAYVMNHVRVCGGVKIIFEHTQRLIERGHDVYIISRASKPDWYPLKARFITVPMQFSLAQYIPDDVDIIICTVADQLPECYLLSGKPVVMFEQGDTYIYEFDTIPPKEQSFYKRFWMFPVPVFGVSKVLIDTLKKNFGVEGTVIHNALDSDIFYPRTQSERDSKPAVLFVGREDVPFKGIRDIRKALESVRNSGRDFDEIWVTQTQPQSPFDGKLFVNPSQNKLGDIYRMSDIYVSGSHYESFPLPPLEAMACGCAVVSTDNGGIMEYAQDGVNCLLGKIGDPQSLAERIIELLDNPQKREYLVQNGYKTVKHFSWDTIMAEWEEHLCTIINLWNDGPKPELTVRRLPQNIRHEEAERVIRDVVQEMDEDYCLWLIEGETISESQINKIRTILRHHLSPVYALQVLYADDVPEHPVVRLENRIYKRKAQWTEEETQSSLILPVRLNGVGDSCFMPDWLRKTRADYKCGDFDAIIARIKSRFSSLSHQEQGIAAKWLALALLESGRDQDCVKVLSQAFRMYPSYSDLSYLLGRILLYNGNMRIASDCFKLALASGTAALYDEYFLDIEKACEMYLQHTRMTGI